MNSFDPPISFTIEYEANGQLSFLDTLISYCDSGNLDISVYRKPTHTDRYLDFNSHHDIKQKLGIPNTFLHRALNLPKSKSRIASEIDRISSTLHSNGYPIKITSEIIKKKIASNFHSHPDPTPEELICMFFKWADQTNQNKFAVLPYIKGTTEPLTRTLKHFNIQVSNKPLAILQFFFNVPKFRPSPDQQCNIVYQIPCASCPWSYIGETKRSDFRNSQKRTYLEC